jgi:hypothetical protein
VFQQLGFCEIPTYFIVATLHTLLLLMYFQHLGFLCIEINNVPPAAAAYVFQQQLGFFWFYRNTERGAESYIITTPSQLATATVFLQIGFFSFIFAMLSSTNIQIMMINAFNVPMPNQLRFFHTCFCIVTRILADASKQVTQFSLKKFAHVTIRLFDDKPARCR